MRRSICFVEPSHALAGQITTWRFAFAPSAKIPKGAKVLFDTQSNGRDIDWQIPTVDLDAKANVIYALMPDGTLLQAEEVETSDSYIPKFEFTLPDDVVAGEEFSVYMGALPDENGQVDAENGNAAQTGVQRRRPFYLFIDPKGEGNYEDPEVFSMDIRGNVLHAIRVLAPSFVVKNKRFDVIVRFEDEFGNLTANAPMDTLIELTYEHLRENLNWKLFVPETGFITLPNLYFNEDGVYTITLRNLATMQNFRSSPIRCFNENPKQLFWGLLHGESDRVDSTENIEACMRHFRDDTAMNFFGTSSFEEAEETPNDIWRLISQNVADFNEDDRFSTILGFQWHGNGSEEGIRHFIYSKDSKPLLRKKEAKNTSLKKIYKHLTPKEAISIPCFSMGKEMGFDFSNFNADFERVVEIYNAWGSSECPAKDGNPFPISVEGKKGVQEDPNGSIQRALGLGMRFGFVAGGLDDRGAYSGLFEGDQVQYSPGMTAVMATGHSRQALYDALYSRSCYATTGQRIIVGIELAGIGMGQEVSTKEKPGLMVNRHISAYVAGTCDLQKIEVIRNGTVIHTHDAEGYSTEFSCDDMEPLDKIALEGPHTPNPFAYYYLRVTQSDGHMAWSSPIWVDLVPAETATPAKRGPKKA